MAAIRSRTFVGLLLTAIAVPGAMGADDPFDAKVRPVLAANCVRCHRGEKARGGLHLDSRAGFLKGGDRGPVVTPGDPDKSLLVQALRYTHDELKMPPDKALPSAVVADIAAWVKAGAAWPKGVTIEPTGKGRPWALEPVAKVVPPPDPSGWSDHPIDRFVRAKLAANGLTPATPAEKRVLIRRVTFDLTGLPPTPEEIDKFLKDSSATAYGKLVDRLLGSPAYGERWGRHWLDVARYADTGGFETDPLYPTAWKFREYVIASFNADKPFDRFVREQVAGDELWPNDAAAVTATAFYCVGPVTPESAMVGTQLEYEWLTDAADTTGTAFLGLTLGCARCHDHKYDPLSQHDYYSLQAVFAASDRPFPDKVRLNRIKALNGLLSDAPVPKDKLNDPRCTVQTEDGIGFHLFHRDEPLEVRRLRRGELSKPEEVVPAGVIAALVPAGKDAAFAGVKADGRRAALAAWLTSADNPLPARVLVNRVWAWHFGQGLVRTPDDFGAQGEPPTHPELLDWLARDCIDHDWSVKHLHRRILLSRTYQSASAVAGPGQKTDPENRLLWHFPRRRLEGEAVRDALLATAGTLNPKRGGPAVVPPLGPAELTGLFDAKGKWPVTKDVAEHTRRSVYLLQRRTFAHPVLAAFDPPEVMTSCSRRQKTVVPSQALALLNSPLANEQAVAFGKRLTVESGGDHAKAVDRAWLLAFGRPPTPSETDRTLTFLRTRGESALTDLALALINANEFVYID
jgi:hypothetical protein